MEHSEVRATRPLPKVEVDAGDVDQHIQPPKLLQLISESSHALVFGDVDRTGNDVEIFPGQLLRCGLGLLEGSRAEEHLHVLLRELAAHLESDAAVGASDQRDR